MIDQKFETFLEVCDSRNFTKAAKKLSLTQPAVSQHIKHLEEELNIKLFNRSENGLDLTPEGKIVLKYVKRIKILHINLHKELLDEKLNIKHLKIGLTPTAESNIITNVLAKYSTVKSNLLISITSDTIKKLYNKLKNYEIDLAIIDGKFQDSELNSILLDTDNLILAVSNSNPLANKQVVTLDELKHEKLILRSIKSGTRELFENHLHSNNESIQSFDVILEVDNIAMIKDLVKNNYGVSILAKSTCNYDEIYNHFKTVTIENLSMIRELNMVYHKDFSHIEILNDIARIYHESKKEK